jgi:hypothetical protein
MDDDFLDACDIDFTEHAVTNEEAELLCLFPEGEVDHAKAEEWKALFSES